MTEHRIGKRAPQKVDKPGVGIHDEVGRLCGGGGSSIIVASAASSGTDASATVIRISASAISGSTMANHGVCSMTSTDENPDSNTGLSYTASSSDLTSASGADSANLSSGWRESGVTQCYASSGSETIGSDDCHPRRSLHPNRVKGDTVLERQHSLYDAATFTQVRIRSQLQKLLLRGESAYRIVTAVADICVTPL